MGRSYSSRIGSGGGDSIPPIRATRLRVGLGAAAVIISGALCAYPVVRAGSLVPAAAVLGAIGVLCTLLALLLRVLFVGPALFGLAAEYVLVEATGRAGAFSIVAYAAGLVVLTETLLWLGQLPSSALVDRRVVVVWLRNLGLTVVAACLLGLVALAATSFEVPGVLAGTLVGCAAAVILLALPWVLRAFGGGHRGEKG